MNNDKLPRAIHLHARGRNSGSAMAEKPSDSTKDPEFQRVLRNMLNTPHKPHSELKVVKREKSAERGHSDAPEPRRARKEKGRLSRPEW